MESSSEPLIAKTSMSCINKQADAPYTPPFMPSTRLSIDLTWPYSEHMTPTSPRHVKARVQGGLGVVNSSKLPFTIRVRSTPE